MKRLSIDIQQIDIGFEVTIYDGSYVKELGCESKLVPGTMRVKAMTRVATLTEAWEWINYQLPEGV